MGESNYEKLKAFIADTYGRQVSEIYHLRAGLVNQSFRVVDQSGEVFVLRISSHKSADEVMFEVEVLLELDEADIPTPSLLANVDGGYLGQFERKPVIMYRYIPGVVPDELDIPMLEELGAYMGKKHAYLKAFKPKVSKPTWEPTALPELYRVGRDELLKIEDEAANAVVAFCDQHIMADPVAPELPQGVTHQDIKRENIIIENGILRGIIDFDNSYYGSLLHDLLTLIMWEGYEGKNLSSARVEAIARGYQAHRPLTTVEIEHVKDAYRHRLIREVFIGPHAAMIDKVTAARRALQFVARYEQLTEPELSLLESIMKSQQT